MAPCRSLPRWTGQLSLSVAGCVRSSAPSQPMAWHWRALQKPKETVRWMKDCQRQVTMTTIHWAQCQWYLSRVKYCDFIVQCPQDFVINSIQKSFGITACAGLCSARAAEVTFAILYMHEYLYHTKERKSIMSGRPLPLVKASILRDPCKRPSVSTISKLLSARTISPDCKSNNINNPSLPML